MFDDNKTILGKGFLLLMASFMVSLPLSSYAADRTSSSMTQRSESSVTRTSSVPRIAVTDLSYEEKVANHFVKRDSHSSSSSSHSSSGGGGAFAGNAQSSSENSEHFESGTEEIIDRGELRKFTADIKGQMIKSRQYKVVQGKPWISKDTESLYDIIERIKSGYYPNADFVLFGSINSFDARVEANNIQGSNATNFSLSYEMSAEFSLINTKTYEVVAAFSALGEGSDSKLMNRSSGTYTPSRSKALSELSQSLGESVVTELAAQFPTTETESHNSEESSMRREERVIRYQ